MSIWPRRLPTQSTDSRHSARMDSGSGPLRVLDADPAETSLMMHPPEPPTTLADALVRLAEAQDTLRAIGAGEIDAFVVSDGGTGRRVFTLSTADRPYRKFVENMRDGAATLSPGGLILYANSRLAELLTRRREELVGAPLATFLAHSATSTLQRIRDQAADMRGTVELELLDADGCQVPVLVGISPLELDDGGYLSCLTFTDLSEQRAQDQEIARLGVAQAERLTELKEAQASLMVQATHDALTGLPNRALLVDRVEQALVQDQRSGRCTAIYFVDLDQFKQVNDTYGHAVGDAVLRTVGQRLVGAVRPMDTVARIGGDEFVVLAHDVDNQLHAVDIGGRLVAALRATAFPHGVVESVAASIGIAVSVGGHGTAEQLLNQADAAMYQAKSLGGGCAEVFDAALGLQAQLRATAWQMLQSALDQHRVIAYYQPIMDLSVGSIAGFEALARISDHEGNLVQPAQFISIAEESGLVVPLGAEMLGLACAEARRWSPPIPNDPALTVAVNLSSRQFETGGLPTLVARTLQQTGLRPRQLHLELTETATIDLRPEVLLQLREIRDLGVEIGLDDFGTGYGSLTHLRSLPLSFVKIDRSFVSGLGTNNDDDRIVAAVVNLSANLGFRSIAEGVETPEQHEILREMGCNQAQGYLFSRPVHLDGVSELLARRAS